MADLQRINANWDRFSEAQKAELRNRLTAEEKTQLVAMRKGGADPAPQAEPKSQGGFLSGVYEGSPIPALIEMGKGAIQQGRQLQQNFNAAPGMLDKARVLGKGVLEATPGYQMTKGILANSGQQLGQARDLYRQGDYTGAVGRAAAAVPIVGPLADQVTDTAITEDNLPKAAGQVTGILASAFAPKIAPKAAGILNKGAKKLASREVVQGLAPTGQAKTLAREVAPELVDRGFVAGTFDGVATKAATKASEAGAKIDQFFQALPDDTTVRVGPILKRMTEKGVDDFIVADLPDGVKLAASKQAEGAIARMQDLKRRLADAATYKNGQLVVPVKTLRKFRQNWDEIAADAKRYGGVDLADTSAARAQGLAADAARDAINSSFPELAALNKQFGMWRKTADVAEATALRKQGQSSFVRHIAGAAVGGAIPGVGPVAGVLASEALSYPGVRLGNAQALRGLGAGATMAAPYGGILGPVSLGQQGILSQGDR